MFDPIINSKLNRLLEGGGYSEEGTVLTFNGDATNKTIILGTVEAVKISNKYVDLNTIENVVIDGSVITKDELVVIIEDVIQILGSYNGEQVLMIAIPEDIPNDATKGVYVCPVGSYYVTKATFAETIHPIDPKYLPGVCLPVVEIANIDAITAEESAKLKGAIGMPCIVKIGDDTEGFAEAMAYLGGGDEHLFVNASGAIGFRSTDNGATWILLQ